MLYTVLTLFDKHCCINRYYFSAELQTLYNNIQFQRVKKNSNSSLAKKKG